MSRVSEQEERMKAAKKFMFDVDFDDEERFGPASRQDAGGSNAPGQQQAAPVFSEQDVAAAREEAFAQGKEQGVTETLSSLEAQLLQTAENIASKFGEILEAQSLSNEQLHKDAVSLTTAFMHKLFPHVMKQHGVDEVFAMTEMAIDNLVEEPRISIHVAEAVADPLRDRLSSPASGRAIGDNIVISGDPDMAAGDCVIEWSDGAAERSQEKLWRELDQIIERYLSQDLDFPARPKPTAGTDMAEAETAVADISPEVQTAIDDVATEPGDIDAGVPTQEASGDMTTQDLDTAAPQADGDEETDTNSSDDPADLPNGELPQ